MTQKAVISFIFAIAASFYFAVWSAMAATSQPDITPTPAVNPGTEQSVASSSAQAEYTLPYPGILPDHPLYRIKLFRDKVLDFLIRDPQKRIEFNILMADKRLNMGVYLMDRGNALLAEETVSKGEKYFVNAVDELASAKGAGIQIRPDIMDKMHQSIRTHDTIVRTLYQKSPENFQPGFQSSLDLIAQTASRIQSFSN